MVPGYTQEEKIAISKRHLLPKQLKVRKFFQVHLNTLFLMLTVTLLLSLQEHGLTEQDIKVPGDSLKAISEYKTHSESGIWFDSLIRLWCCHTLLVRYCAYRRSNASISSDMISCAFCFSLELHSGGWGEITRAQDWWRV